VEYKLNFLSPAMGDRLVARGEVVRRGAKVVVSRSDVAVFRDKHDRLMERKLVATALGTLVPV
jgi:acyl-coenzyme A thioesterase PaaI-like protein